MNQEYIKWLTYWKKNLSDSLNTHIEIEGSQHFEIENFKIEQESITDLQKVNALIDFEEKRINEKKGIKSKEDEQWIAINHVFVVIAPFKLKPASDHLVHLKDNKPKFPFWFSVYLDRNGKLYIPDEMFPLFQRKYLEPLADERTEFIFGAVEDVDQATTLGKENYTKYAKYIHYVKDIFKSVVHQELSQYRAESYETILNAIVLLPQDEMNAAMGIIELYEKILNQKNIPQLLESLITLKNNHQKPPVAVLDLIDSNELHLGQMGFDFPISISQRKSLNTLLTTNDTIFAVNGPPGTGKTTLLQSIVANKMVESALQGKEAPVILACSTNNQAVTNIIDSFSRSNTREGKLQGRWIPDVDGYATYLPSTRKKEAELKGINYKKLSGGGLFDDIENVEFLQKAKDYFLEKSKAYFNSSILNISTVTQKLRSEISAIEQSLKEAAIKWKAYLQSENVFTFDYLLSNPKLSNYYKEGILNDDILKNDIQDLMKDEQDIISYFDNEPFFRKFFCFLGIKSALKSRSSEIKIILRDSLIVLPEAFVFKKNLLLEKIDSKINMAKSIVSSIENWKEWKNKNRIKGNPPRTEEEYWDFEFLKINEKVIANCFYDELDVSLRHKAFQLALHYWEGRYLLELESSLLDSSFEGKGKDPMMMRWQRHAMLTPCFVSTFYMAPKFFSFYKFFKKADDGKNVYDNPPLFDFIDLLIVDEAGQVSPEVGIATFALAKQAVIVGDVKQIEPVWNVTHKIDIGNLKKSGIIQDYDDTIYEKEFDPKGFLSSTGSIMKMAQNASGFKEPNLHEKGVLLTEHRRCYDEIINYCNVLAYDGQLIPLRGKAKKDLLFPPMYCIHVDGQSTKNENGSRYNNNEVKEIVEWLVKNKQDIEGKYGPIEEAVGIITPFTGQKNNLKAALKQAGFKTDDFKIGTVHALQGAERPLVLFSMVYGDEDKGTMFFDRDNKPNMLNVAVSRAKDNFIVFANTGILNNKAKTPSGILSKFLVYDHKIQTSSS
ncbi:AAA domain-containing protein [Chryseobacterium sp. OV279]|uniref:AAA domain-containing protein n=1 Tax=Chryseobacterium sp. OV279 TaxID=1500285 RepID=UPI00090F69D2|nr:AAA domain-containing protein [Chryseobacterium sp. OV279]SHF81734.1 AAA domain-containing protein [Chryseobacterium sp. OV279]